jgi:hypothetical protein
MGCVAYLIVDIHLHINVFVTALVHVFFSLFESGLFDLKMHRVLEDRYPIQFNISIFVLFNQLMGGLSFYFSRNLVPTIFSC